MMGSRFPSSRVTLDVDEVWKGLQRETLEVDTPRDGAICGYPFKEGEEYLVFAYGKQEPYKVDLCSETKPLSKAGAEIAWLDKLGNGKKSKDGDDEEEALTDTSGGFSVRAMVGMAGLAMVASLLLVVRLARTGQAPSVSSVPL